jgi:hypothetical protein
MNFAEKISLLAAGLFLLAGMLTGVLKYYFIMKRASSAAPVYIDIAHRTALLYSFAMLVAARLLEFSPYSVTTQTFAAGLMILFFALTFGGHLSHGLKDDTDNIFRARNFATTWFMYLLIPAHLVGLSIILWGFVATQFFGAK